MERVQKSGRKRTGTVQPFTDAQGRRFFRARLRLADSSRHWERVPEEPSPAFLAWCREEGIKLAALDAKERARAWARWLQEQEDANGAILAAKRAAAAEAAALPAPANETCDAWYERYYAYQKELGRSSANDARGCWRAWISPRIGPRPIASITRDDVEDIRDALDRAIEKRRVDGRTKNRESISGKRSMNVWSALTAAFRQAVGCKRRELRARADNPCVGVEPPGDRSSRKARRKPFIYPNEAARLFTCKAVPFEWRELHAIAAYTYLRPGELRVLRWSDVDLEHGIIHVTRAWDSRDAKVKAPKTRNGVRPVPVHPNLAPLLARMHADAKRARNGASPAEDLVVPLLAGTHEDFVARETRAHLKAADVTRPALHADTATTVQANFRSWRDSGITWLALAGVDVVKIQRRAGHDNIATTLGYVKQAEELGGQPLGTPFGPLPAALTGSVRSTNRSTRAPRVPIAAKARAISQCEGRDLNATSDDETASFSGDREGEGEDDGEVSARSVEMPVAVDQLVDHDEGMEAALAKALEGATAAGRWDVVAQLAKELEARRLARAGNVVRLEDAKRGT